MKKIAKVGIAVGVLCPVAVASALFISASAAPSLEDAKSQVEAILDLNEPARSFVLESVTAIKCGSNPDFGRGCDISAMIRETAALEPVEFHFFLGRNWYGQDLLAPLGPLPFQIAFAANKYFDSGDDAARELKGAGIVVRSLPQELTQEALLKAGNIESGVSVPAKVSFGKDLIELGVKIRGAVTKEDGEWKFRTTGGPSIEHTEWKSPADEESYLGFSVPVYSDGGLVESFVPKANGTSFTKSTMKPDRNGKNPGDFYGGGDFVIEPFETDGIGVYGSRRCHFSRFGGFALKVSNCFSFYNRIWVGN